MRTKLRPHPAPADVDYDLSHLVCPCDHNRSLCGEDMSDVAFGEAAKTTCVVCDDLQDVPCRRCGT